ncbi:MAG: 50S ribosomal protein L10 [Candidatus Micrarchaeia archaeon]
MLKRSQKEELVKRLSKEIEAAKTVAIMPISGIPDRLLQKARNQLRGEAKIIITRKTLLERAMADKREKLAKYVDGNVALVLTDKDPFELYKKISSNVLPLQAKPGQTAPADIIVKAGETDVAPGQAVTELKAAGIDVQIQKNKVVIAKDKVVAEAGKRISTEVANALKLLNIKPFSASTTLSVAYSAGLIFGKEALSINEEYVASELAKSFAEANSLSIGIGYITQYNASYFVTKAYAEALALGLEAKIPEPEIVEKLVKEAANAASELNAKTQQQQAAS